MNLEKLLCKIHQIEGLCISLEYIVDAEIVVQRECLEYFNGVRNLGELFSLSIKELVNGLFELMVKFEHSLNKTVIDPWVGFNDDGKFEQMYQEVFVLDGEMDSEQEALAYAEHNFNLWLIDQMHTLENGMRF